MINAEPRVYQQLSEEGLGVEETRGLGPANEQGVDLSEEYLSQAVRCRMCGQVQDRGDWLAGAAAYCEHFDCCMREYGE